MSSETAARPPIPVRQVSLPFDPSIPRHWFAGNALETHIFNGLNLLFPDGERFFIASVQEALPRVRDPELRRQVKGFFGQEALHAREHERYFDVLRAQDYRVDRFLRRFRRYCEWNSRWLPAPLRLAMTAGAEHWTATLGASVLRGPALDAAHPTMRMLALWHAAEEVEHRSVAFDVLQETHPGYLLRVTGFLLATASLFVWAAVGTRMLLRQDGISRHEVQALHRAARARGAGHLPELVRQGFWVYLRRDFHPSQDDALAEAEARLAELGLAGAASA